MTITYCATQEAADAIAGPKNVVWSACDSQGNPTSTWTVSTDSDYVAPPAAQPDVAGFLMAVETAVGGPMAVNGLMQAVPIFYPTVEGGDWAGTQAIVSVAHSTGVITDAIYQAIKTAATNNAIPLNLA